MDICQCGNAVEDVWQLSFFGRWLEATNKQGDFAPFGTMFLSFGNAFTFGGLLATLPDQEVFDHFQANIGKDI